MRILMINVVCGIRSTGRICTDIADALTAQGHEVKIAYGRETVPEKYQKYAVKIGSDFGIKIHGLRARLFDGAGFGSKLDTKKFIEWVKEFDPDVIHLHNIHGYYINIEVLFDYLHTCGKKIIWTLHDCWAFTGHCAHYENAECYKWKDVCDDCTCKEVYPTCNGISRSKVNFNRKRTAFSNIQNMTIVTPSEWLRDQVQQSFLKEYPVVVIHNGIDTRNFYPRGNNTDLLEKFGLEGKKVAIAVGTSWFAETKGLKYLLDLNDKISDDWVIVIVGVTEEVKKTLPESIIAIERSNSVDELADWYSIADVMINPTLEDTYPTVNLEAISCGTPVISFKTGGSSESAEMYGCTVEKKDVDGLVRAMGRISDFALNQNFLDAIDCTISTKSYLKLYGE